MFYWLNIQLIFFKYRTDKLLKIQFFKFFLDFSRFEIGQIQNWWMSRAHCAKTKIHTIIRIDFLKLMINDRLILDELFLLAYYFFISKYFLKNKAAYFFDENKIVFEDIHKAAKRNKHAYAYMHTHTCIRIQYCFIKRKSKSIISYFKSITIWTRSTFLKGMFLFWCLKFFG
jgi:hypothetical protein